MFYKSTNVSHSQYSYESMDECVYTLDIIRTDNVATDEGIDLSSSRDDIIAAYGEPASEVTGSLVYELNGTTLKFIFDGDNLSSIEYDSELNN